MKKVLSIIISVCTLLSLLGCQKPATQSTVAETTSTTAPTAQEGLSMDVPFTAVSVPAVTQTIAADDGTVIFTKSYQDISLTLSGQAAADKIVLDFLNKVDLACTNADAIASTVQNAYSSPINWTPYSCTVRFDPTRLDQSVLSLYGTSVSYSGGSHPDRTCLAANYDLITGDALTLGSILTHEDATNHLCQLVIDALDKIKAEKQLHTGYADLVKERFSGEESYDDDWYFSETGLCFYFAPYEIAPYSSGIVTAEVPYSKLVGIIADGYFPSERQVLTGKITFSQFDQSNTTYSHISELIFQNDGQMYTLQSDSCVQDIRIMVKNPQTSESYIAYAALYLNPGDAIVIQCEPSLLDTINVHYQSGGETIVLALSNQ